MLALLLLTEKADVTPAVLARAAAVKRVESGAMVIISAIVLYYFGSDRAVDGRRLTNDNGIALSRVKFKTKDLRIPT